MIMITVRNQPEIPRHELVDDLIADPKSPRKPLGILYAARV